MTLQLAFRRCWLLSERPELLQGKAPVLLSSAQMVQEAEVDLAKYILPVPSDDGKDGKDGKDRNPDGRGSKDGRDCKDMKRSKHRTSKGKGMQTKQEKPEKNKNADDKPEDEDEDGSNNARRSEAKEDMRSGASPSDQGEDWESDEAAGNEASGEDGSDDEDIFCNQFRLQGMSSSKSDAKGRFRRLPDPIRKALQDFEQSVLDSLPLDLLPNLVSYSVIGLTRLKHVTHTCFQG